MILNSLEKYKRNGQFHFKPENSLREVCNAPTNASGIYLIYASKKGKDELIYIGCSGKLNKDQTIFIRKAGLGGIKDRLVNGHQFGKIPRRKSWPLQMEIEQIDCLNIRWYVTHNDSYCDCPRKIENDLLVNYLKTFKKLPVWNREL